MLMHRTTLNATNSMNSKNNHDNPYTRLDPKLRPGTMFHLAAWAQGERGDKSHGLDVMNFTTHLESKQVQGMNNLMNINISSNHYYI